jgi:hypothetical protein
MSLHPLKHKDRGIILQISEYGCSWVLQIESRLQA